MNCISVKRLAVNLGIVASGVLLLLLSTQGVEIPSPFLSTMLSAFLVLFFPGLLVQSLVPLGRMTLWVKIPLAFALSLTMWMTPSIFLIFMHSNLEVLKWIVVISVLLLCVFSIGRSMLTSGVSLNAKESHCSIPSSKFNWAALFLIVSVVCIGASVIIFFVATASIAQPSDRWEYTAYIQHYLDSERFLDKSFLISSNTPLSPRMTLSAWLVVLALVDRMAQVDLADLYCFYLPLVFIVVAYLALYNLAIRLFKRHGTAVIVCFIQTILYFSTLRWVSGLNTDIGFSFFLRIVEDKGILQFILLPVIQTIALEVISVGVCKGVRLTILAMIVLGSVLLHPLAPILAGISLVALLLFDLPFGRDAKARWLMYVTVLVLIVTAVILLVQRQYVVSEDVNSARYTSTDTLPLSLLRVWDGLYVVDFVFLSGPIRIAVVLLMPLFLVFIRKKLAARFLFSNLIIPGLIVYNPVIVPVVSRFVGNTIVWRITWLFPFSLVIGFFVQELGDRLRKRLLVPSLQMNVLLMVSLGLLAGGLLHKDIVEGIRFFFDYRENGVTRDEKALWMYLRTVAIPGSTVMTPIRSGFSYTGADSFMVNNIPGIAGGRIYGVAFTAYPRRYSWNEVSKDLAGFYGSPILDMAQLRVIKKYDVRYVVVRANHLLNRQFISLQPVVQRIYQNAEFNLYELYDGWAEAPLVQYLVKGNTLFAAGRYSEAEVAFTQVLKIAPDNFWAHVAMGDVLYAQGTMVRAASMYMAALSINEDYQTHLKLGDTYRREREFPNAVLQYDRAHELFPVSADPIIRLNELYGDIYKADGNIAMSLNAYKAALSMAACPPSILEKPIQIYTPPGWLSVSLDRRILAQTQNTYCSDSNSGFSDSITRVVDNYDFIVHFDAAQRSTSNINDIRRDVFIIGTEPQGILFQHPPSTITYTVQLASSSTLMFSLTLSPEVWQPGKGDGVQFDIRLENAKGLRWHLFSRYIDPKNIPEQRQWLEQAVDLRQWAGQNVTITFSTGCGPNNNCDYDWAGWGEPRIVQPVAYNFLEHFSEAKPELAAIPPGETKVVTQTINYDTRSILFEHPSARVVYSLTLPLQSSLRFGLGMSPEVWSPDKGDGVEYNIYVRKQDEPYKLYWIFQNYIDPKNNPDDRHWFDESVDLSQFGGQTVEIIFEALPGPVGNTNYDWGGWSSPVLIDETLPENDQTGTFSGDEVP